MLHRTEAEVLHSSAPCELQMAAAQHVGDWYCGTTDTSIVLITRLLTFFDVTLLSETGLDFPA